MKNALEIAKSLLEVLKSGLIVFVLLAIVLMPGVVNSSLAAIGIREFDLWGLKGNTSLAQVAQDLAGQRQINQGLAREVEHLRELLAATAGVGGNGTLGAVRPPTAPPSIPTVTQALADSARVIDAARTAGAAAQRTLDSNAERIAAAQQSLPVGGQWAVVFGADATAEEARREIERARRAGFDTASIFFRQNWFRSAVVFPDRAAAQGALARVQALGRTAQGAYVVRMETWCGAPRPSEADVMACPT